jgi:hypothetical protein
MPHYRSGFHTTAHYRKTKPHPDRDFVPWRFSDGPPPERVKEFVILVSEKPV